MILNMKIDAKDRVWLLWCSSLRAEETEPKKKKKIEESVQQSTIID
jgi:hypothetical protein